MPPIYMDRHDLPGVTARDVAEAHHADVKIQDKYNCHALTYWFDEERGNAFCLIEAPDKEAVKNMHDQAHGLVPHQLIEVDRNLVKAFLGRIEDPVNPDADQPLALNESAFRVIMSTELKEAALLKSKLGAAAFYDAVRFVKEAVQAKIEKHRGSIVGKIRESSLSSFTQASAAVLCAMDIQAAITQHTIPGTEIKLQLNIGLHAGTPVTDSPDIFGQTIQMAKQLSSLGPKGCIVASSLVGNMLKHDNVSVTSPILKILHPHDEKFINQLAGITEKSWHEPLFDIPYIVKELAVSKSQLYRKTIALTGYSPSDLIRDYRLEKAARLIIEMDGNVSEIAYQTGFTSPSYFSKCFRKRFGVLPSDYARHDA